MLIFVRLFQMILIVFTPLLTPVHAHAHCLTYARARALKRFTVDMRGTRTPALFIRRYAHAVTPLLLLPPRAAIECARARCDDARALCCCCALDARATARGARSSARRARARVALLARTYVTRSAPCERERDMRAVMPYAFPLSPSTHHRHCHRHWHVCLIMYWVKKKANKVKAAQYGGEGEGGKGLGNVREERVRG